MYKIVDFYLLTETKTKDRAGQLIPVETQTLCIGKEKSVYQNEYYKAEQNGLRPQGVIEMSAFDYSGQKFLLLNGNKFSIYRTYEIGTDRIELFYGERVGNNG